MRTFSAIVFTASGEEQTLSLQGDTLEAVRQYLHEQGYTIKRLQEAFGVSLWDKLQSIELGERIKPAHKIRLLKTLGKMMGRGYSLAAIIDFLIADEREKDVLKLLRILQAKAEKGYRDYAELFSEAREYFDDEFFSILVAGQKTGTVGPNMIEYSERKEKMLAQKSALVKALSGKFVLLGIVGIAFLVIVTAIVPQLTKLFGKKLELPLGMKIMVAISSVLRGYFALCLSLFMILIFGGFFLYRFHTPTRFAFQHLVLNIPVLGPLLRMMATANFLSLLGHLSSKGVSILEAIRIVIEQTKNLCFRSVFTAIEVNLNKGIKLEQILRSQGADLVPPGYLLPSVAQAMTLGAKGGNLGEVLLEAYESYDIQLQHRMSQITSWISAAISLFTYAVILFMIGSLAATLFKVMGNPTALIGLSVFREILFNCSIA